MRRVIFLPVGYAEAADRIVDLVERRILTVQDHWLSREACQAFIDRQPRELHARYAPTAAVIRVVEDTEREASPPANSVSMIERRDGVRVFGEPIIEGADGEGMAPLLEIGLVFASRSFDGQGSRHVA